MSFLSKIATLFPFFQKTLIFDSRKINQSLGKWMSYNGSNLIKPGVYLPKKIVIPANLLKEYKEGGEISFSSIVFPIWLRISKQTVAYYAKMAKSGKGYTQIETVKKDGSQRVLYSPEPVLKMIQQHILQRILYQVQLPDSCHGFCPSRSIFSAAQPHAGKRIVLAMDIKDFFPSISFSRVMYMFCSLGFAKKEASLLAGVCCCNKILPQGAPTSPMIANLVCRRLDRRLEGFAKKHQIEYTRYADDLIFSGDQRLIGFINRFRQIIEDEKFTLNESKIRIMRSGSRQHVLGLNLNASQISIPRKKRRVLRALLHQQQKSGTYIDQIKLSYANGFASFMNLLYPKTSQQIKEKILLILKR